MPQLKTHKFARKPFFVDAARVNDANMELVAEWCSGEIKKDDETGQRYIEVNVYRPMTPRQTMAFVGDWVLDGGSGFKVYNPKAFDKAFEKVKTLTKAQADEAGIKVPHEPKKYSKPQADAAGIKVPHEPSKPPVPMAPKVEKPESKAFSDLTFAEAEALINEVLTDEKS